MTSCAELRPTHTLAAAEDGLVTVIVELTPVVVHHVQVVAAERFTGYGSADTAAWPDAVTVMDPLHVGRGRGRGRGHRARRMLWTRAELLSDSTRCSPLPIMSPSRSSYWT